MVFESRNRTGSERLTSHRRRSGLVIVLTALLLVFFLGMIAFAVDLGIIANTRTELQMAADAADSLDSLDAAAARNLRDEIPPHY